MEKTKSLFAQGSLCLSGLSFRRMGYMTVWHPKEVDLMLRRTVFSPWVYELLSNCKWWGGVLFYSPNSTNTCSMSNDRELGTLEPQVSKTHIALILLATGWKVTVEAAYTHSSTPNQSALSQSQHNLPPHHHFLCYLGHIFVCMLTRKRRYTHMCMCRCLPCCLRQSLTNLQLAEKAWLTSKCTPGFACLCIHSNGITWAPLPWLSSKHFIN